MVYDSVRAQHYGNYPWGRLKGLRIPDLEGRPLEPDPDNSGVGNG
jgi:hypothetical protein